MNLNQKNREQRNQKVVAVIPAFNEDRTIGNIIRVLKRVREISLMIVVDDGSTDHTRETALAAGAEVLSLPENHGKGYAMEQGVALSDAPVILFMDADIEGLREDHVRQLLSPVLGDACDMMIGVIDRGDSINEINRFFEAPFSGLRVLTREIWNAIPGELKKGYAVDSMISIAAKKMDKRVQKITLLGARNFSKPKKRGFWRGIMSWFRMWGEIGVHALLSFKIK